MMLTFETVEYISQLWHPHPSSLISKESLSSPKYSTKKKHINCSLNSVSVALESGIQFKDSGILLTI